MAKDDSLAHFTNQYPITKTLRFELKPQGKTQHYLDAAGIVETDRQRAEALKEIKQHLDVLYKRFIEEALASLEFEYGALETVQVQINSNNKDIKTLDTAKAKLREAMAVRYGQVKKEWSAQYGLKKGEPLFAEGVLQIITSLLPESRAPRAVFENFGITTYLEPFFDNRKHLFGAEGKASQVATRAIDENLPIFIKNIEKAGAYQGILDMPTNLFELNEYGNYLNQTAIDEYNAQISLINQHINELPQRADKQARRKMPLLRYLYKQILSDKEQAEQMRPLQTLEEYNDFVQTLIRESGQQDALCDKITSLFFGGDSDYERIYLTRQALNTISNSWLNGEWSLLNNVLPEDFRKKPANEEQKRLRNFISIRQLLNALEANAEYTAKDLFGSEGEKDGVFLGIWQAKLMEARKNEMNTRGKVEVGDMVTVKAWLDARLALERMLRWWSLEYNRQAVTELERDEQFYALLDQWLVNDFIASYNRIRNFATAKRYSLDKWKLNFNKSTLFKGWSLQDGISQYHGYILSKNGKYYLAVTTSNSILNGKNIPAAGENVYLKMQYRKLKSTTLYGSAYEGFYGSKYKSDKAVFGDREIIGRVKELLKQKYLSYFPEVNNILHIEFTTANELAKALSNHPYYRVVFDDSHTLPADYVEKGQYNIQEKTNYLYLFEIQNKDMYLSGSHKKNLHTLFFEQLLSRQNNDRSIKFELDGGAEIFFRPKSIKAEIKPGYKSHVVINKRFTENKIMFHLPITINFGAAKMHNKDFNARVRMQAQSGRGAGAIIGIDRGEKHLAYIAICNEKGELLEAPRSLNNVNKIPYLDLLMQRENERDEARKAWEAIRSIKELKAGFVGHAVKEIADLAIKHNAFIVMEDLNFGFKRGRLHIERSVYQRLESALLTKLQYYVDKKIAEGSGSVAAGLQFTPPKVEPKDVQKQMGMVLFTTAAYTSAIDPASGFRRHFKLDGRDFAKVLCGFDEIYFDASTQSYHFVFSWDKLAAANSSVKSKSQSSDRRWTITANVERLYWRRQINGRGETQKYNPNTELRKLFERAGLGADSSNMKEVLLAHKADAKFRESFYFYFNLITQLRNSDGSIDYISSPVVGRNGGFHSDNGYKGYKWNGDANGALNIARKGALMVAKLKSPEEKIDLRITDREWDDWYASQ